MSSNNDKSRHRSPLTRSQIMSRVGQRDTKPEITLRRHLWRLGFRYRTNYRIEGVRVDIAFTRARLAVFVDGCFWHSCPEHATRPSMNSAFWQAKFAANRERDERQSVRLREAGWTVMRCWEHDCRGECNEAVARIQTVLASNRAQ